MGSEACKWSILDALGTDILEHYFTIQDEESNFWNIFSTTGLKWSSINPPGSEIPGFNLIQVYVPFPSQPV